MNPHFLFIPFLFAIGACVGSFLNVVVWRLPRNESLVSPPSHCPKCNARLAWFDNIPVFGWLMLRGKCRYCREPISPRYPIVEAVCGLLFVFYYVAFFIWQVGPCAPRPTMIYSEITNAPMEMVRTLTIQTDWPIFALNLFLIASLLAASLIDAELFIIPIEIPWLAALVAVVIHSLVDRPSLPGALSVGSLGGAVAVGGSVGLIVSLILFRLKLIGRSFEKGEPLLEVDREEIARDIEVAKREGRTLDYEGELPPAYTRGMIRLEIGKEMLFLLPPLIGAGLLATLLQTSPTFAQTWNTAINSHDWLGGLLGSLLGILVGGFVVWITRILGTLGFGRVAMGLGDVHLMCGVGAVLGAGAATVAFFLAPFFGILIALWMLATGKRRELPYGPYLSLATAVVMLCYCPIAAYLSPGLLGMLMLLRKLVGLPE